MATPTETVEREPARSYYRQPTRLRPPPEPHEKYHIDPATYPDGCDCVWAAFLINGQDNGEIGHRIDGGWVPARAADFPEHSGYGKMYPDSVVRRGLVATPKADDVIIKDGQMLFCRAKELSERADQHRIAESRFQLDTQMERLALSSRRAIKDRTQINYGRQYANPDQLPEFAAYSQGS